MITAIGPSIPPKTAANVVAEAPHMRGIVEALLAGRLYLSFVSQGSEPFNVPVANKPILFIINDAPALPGVTAGPDAFHKGSLRRLLQSADVIALRAHAPEREFYTNAARAAADRPADGRPNAVIIETTRPWEGSWLRMARQAKPVSPILLAVRKAEGVAA